MCNPSRARTPLSIGLVLVLLVGCGELLGPARDRTPPQLELDSALHDLVLESDSVVIELTASDDRMVRSVGYRLDGGAMETVPITAAREVAVRIVLRDLAIGAHRVELMVEDEAGQWNVLVIPFGASDTTAPALLLSSPEENAETPSDSVQVT